MSSLTKGEVLTRLDAIGDPCLAAAGLQLSILDLGLIGDVAIDGDRVDLEITFTEAGCMFTHRIIAQIQDELTEIGAATVTVTPRWAPAWTESRLSAKGAGAFRAIRERYDDILNPSHVLATRTRMDDAALTVDEPR